MSFISRLFPNKRPEPSVRVDPPLTLPPRTLRYRYSTFDSQGREYRREIEIEEGNCEFVQVAVAC